MARVKRKTVEYPEKFVMVRLGKWDHEGFDKARAEAGFTHEEFADEVSKRLKQDKFEPISAAMVRKLASGERAPSEEKYVAICSVLKCGEHSFLKPPGLAYHGMKKLKIRPEDLLKDIATMPDEVRSEVDSSVIALGHKALAGAKKKR